MLSLHFTQSVMRPCNNAPMNIQTARIYSRCGGTQTWCFRCVKTQTKLCAYTKRAKLNGIMSANSYCGTQVSTTANIARFKEFLCACIFMLVNKINLCEQETVYGGIKATQFIQTQISRRVCDVLVQAISKKSHHWNIALDRWWNGVHKFKWVAWQVLFVHFNVPALFPISEGNANSLTAATLELRSRSSTWLERDLKSFSRNSEWNYWNAAMVRIAKPPALECSVSICTNHG